MLQPQNDDEWIARLAVAAVLRKRTAVDAWRALARESQLPPSGFPETPDWYIRGGRGSGKTWTAAHVFAEAIEEHPPGDWGIVAPTYGDGRDTCVEGPSGLLKALGPDRIKAWNRSMGEIQLAKGGTVFVDGADDGALRVQGKNLRGVWADEVGLWKVNQWKRAWDESIGFAVRLAPSIRIATGTPKRGHPLVRLLYSSADVLQTLLLTEDNIDNLDPTTVAKWRDRWEGTTLGGQELRGEVLEDVEGSLWKEGQIAYKAPYFDESKDAWDVDRIVIAIDPAATSGMSSDETGIVAAAKGHDGLGYVMEDWSVRGSPAEWAGRAVRLYHRLKADRIVAEVNNGGEMVEHTIRTVDANVPVTMVHASRGKKARAEPISAKYEQHRVFHVKPLPELEDQMLSWVPVSNQRDESEGASPDRVDALVWALSHLMLDDAWGTGGGSTIA